MTAGEATPAAAPAPGDIPSLPPEPPPVAEPAVPVELPATVAAASATEAALHELVQRFDDLVDLTFERSEVQDEAGSGPAAIALRRRLHNQLWRERFRLAEGSAAHHATLVAARRRRAAAAGWSLRPGRRGRQLLAQREVARAMEEWTQAVVEEGLLQLALDEIRDEALSTDTTVRPLDASRLLPSDDRAPFVPTAASRRVERLLDAAGSTVVAVGGDRGAGKSTVLRHVARPDPARPGGHLVVLMAAPASTPSHEFVVHLFGEVCRAVLAHCGWAGDDDAVAERALVPAIGVAAALTVTAAVATVLLLAWSPIVAAAGWAVARPPAAWTALAAAAGGATTVALRWAGRRRLPADDMARLATHHLARLRYLRTEMAESAATIELARWLKVGRSRGRQRTEQPRTYPELVADLRRFLERLGLSLRARQDPEARVVVVVDEIDKLDVAGADRFLDGLRPLVGAPGCHYLVAVSEEARRAFEQRLLEGPTTVDSTFDAVVGLPGLSLRESRQVLWTRVPLPEPCVLLCHVLSGGRPRDLLRTAFELAEQRNHYGLADVGRLARHLVEHDLRRVAVGAARVPGAQAWSDGGVGEGDAPAEAIEAWAADTPDVETPEAATLAAWLYHVATVRRAFVNDLGGTLVTYAAADPATAERARDGLADLAWARLAVVDRPRTAWDLIGAYRRGRGWPPLAWPWPSAPDRLLGS